MDQAANDRAAAAEARRRRILERGQARFSQITATYNASAPEAHQPAAHKEAQSAEEGAAQTAVQPTSAPESRTGDTSSATHTGEKPSVITPAVTAGTDATATPTEVFLEPAPSTSAPPADPMPLSPKLSTHSRLDQEQAHPSSELQHPVLTPSLSTQAGLEQEQPRVGTTVPHSAGTSHMEGVSGSEPVQQLRARRLQGSIPAAAAAGSAFLGAGPGVFVGEQVGSGMVGERGGGGGASGVSSADGAGSTVMSTCVTAVQSVMSSTEVVRVLLAVCVAVSLASPQTAKLWPNWPPIVTLWATQLSVALPLILLLILVPSVQLLKGARTSGTKSTPLGILGLIPGMKPVADVLNCVSAVFMMLVDTATIFLVVYVLMQSLADSPQVASGTAGVQAASV